MNGIRSSRIKTIIAAVVALGCAQGVLTPTILPREAIPPTGGSGAVLKVHMRSGALYQLSKWQVIDSASVVAGEGDFYDVNRVRGDSRAVRIPLDSIAVVETNSEGETYTAGLQGLGALAVLGSFMSVACLADPKSCFGSCPTFYVEGPDSARVRAEGFSASVARVLQSKDVDALGQTEANGRTFALHMKNEAWETHMVRRLTLLAAPVADGERVFASGDSMFYRAGQVTAPATCTASEGSCLPTMGSSDGIERMSRADSSDLVQREVVDLTFDTSPSQPALVLTARNSLVTTYLFYQTLAYAGSRYASMLASMEQGTRASAVAQFGMATLLGSIEVQLRDDGGAWRTVGTYGEPGPIASDTKIIPLDNSVTQGKPLNVRLRMAKGNWRIDWAALAELRGSVVPMRLSPTSVTAKNLPDSSALRSLRGDSGTRHLVSLPGHDYRVTFALPRAAGRTELFLESEGYYYEWMRKEWLREENPLMAAAAIADPAGSLRRLAPAYHARERMMDSMFFRSRFNSGEHHATR